MWSQFFLENAHFALNIFAALAFFSVAWLYFDAGLNRENIREILRMVGFSLLSLSFLVHASQVESTLLPALPVSGAFLAAVFLVVRIGAYLSLIASLAIDPIQPKPDTAGHDPLKEISQVMPAGGGLTGLAATAMYPFLALIVGGLYLRRATIGLERHLKPIAIGFLILTVSEIGSLAALARTTTNVFLFNLVAPFGIVWLAEHLILLAAVVWITRWVFGYLLKRFETQLFIILTSIIVIIYLIITVSFTGLLVSNVIAINADELSRDAKVLAYAISGKSAEVLSDAQAVAQDSQVSAIINQKLNRLTLADTVQTRLIAKKQSFLIVVSATGQVVARGEDKYQFGDSLSGDPLVKLALAGQAKSAVTVKDGVMAPEISVYGAAPVTKDNTVIGAVIEGVLLDNAFLDGIKKATGLDATLYAGNVVSATTLTTADGITRPIGTQLTDTTVKSQVLTQNKTYTGSVNLLNRPYFAAYLPLIGQDSLTAGMLSVATPQTTILSMAGQSIEFTFLIVIGLLVVTVIPAYAISRYIARQVR
jgi:hypothetical protein